MAAATGDFSLFTTGILAKLAAISLSTRRDTHAGKMRALALLVRWHNRLLIVDYRLSICDAKLESLVAVWSCEVSSQAKDCSK
jgi:hypothetical protein